MPRCTTAAFAWIERRSADGSVWLAQWNRKWQAFNLVGGHREPGESARECVVREIAEELLIADADDFVVGPQPLARIEFTAWSVPVGQWTDYDMTVFETAITRASALDRVDTNSENRWLSAGELAQGRTDDDRVDTNSENRWLSAGELAQGRTDDGRAVSEVATRFFADLGPHS